MVTRCQVMTKRRLQPQRLLDLHGEQCQKAFVRIAALEQEQAGADGADAGSDHNAGEGGEAASATAV